MRQKFVLFIVTVLFSVGAVAAGAEDCPTLVKTALARAENACAIMRGNQACYGYQTLDVQLQAGLSSFAFNGVGDITPVNTIESLHMSPLNLAKDEWGITVMRVHADISADQPNENVTLLAFGDVSIDADQSETYQPMQAFALKTGDADSGCTDITENGLVIQTPEGVGRVTLWINDIRVRIGSTVLFQAQPGGEMVVSTFEGHAEVQADGETQEATTGMRVRVPLDENMHPTGAPTEPEVFDAESTGLASVVDVITAFTDGSVGNLISSSSTDGGDGTQGAGADGRAGNCNGEHGQGTANGNCIGLDNPNANNGQSQGNGSGNAGGNGSGGGHHG